MPIPFDAALPDRPTLRLPSGHQATLRRAQSHDAALAQSFVRGLSPRTHRRRFHGRLPALGVLALETGLAATHPRHHAVVATVRDGMREVLVGDARFVLEGDGRDAEFAIVVSDALRRQGLGRALMLALQQAAADAGVRWLHGEVHDDNPAMLNLMLSLGFVPTRRDEDAGLVMFETRVGACRGDAGHRDLPADMPPGAALRPAQSLTASAA
jgi:acetyltransferase